MKKVLSIILSIIMILSVVPFSALAADDTNSAKIEADDNQMSFTATNPIAQVITEELEKGSAEETADYVITDLKFNEKIATVSLGVMSDCAVVVAIYSEAGQMLATGISTASQGVDSVDVTIDIDSMPEYFIAQAFLLDEDYAPLCPEFTTIEEMQCYEEFMEKSVDDFDADDVIINFDEQKDDNFAVLADGGSAVFGSTGKNILVSADYENEIYKFENIDSDISSLSIGDVFYYEYNDEMLIIKVTDIDIKGMSATVTGDKSAELEDYFSFVKINISTETNGSDFTVNTEGADEGVEYVGNEKWEDDVLNDDFNTYASIGDAAEISCPVWKLNEYFAGNGDSSNVRLTGQVKASVEYDIKIHYDPLILTGSLIVSTNPLLSGVVSYNAYKSVKAVFGVKVKGTVTLTGELSKDVFLGTLDFVTPVGIVCSVGFRLAFSLSAAVTFTIAEISQTIGFDYKKDGEIKSLCTKPYIDITPNLKGKLEGSIGLKISPSISFIKLLEVSINPEVGVKAEMTLLDTDGDDIENHLCKICFDGKFKFYIKVKLVGEIFGENIGQVKLTPEYEKHLKDFYYSVTYNDFGWGICTHVGNDNDEPDNPVDPDNPDTPDEPDTPNENGVTDSGKCGDNLTWTLYNDGELRIDGSGAMYNYYPYYDCPWITYYDQITSVTIPDSITTIGDNAFCYCYRVTSVTIPDSVNIIGSYAFENCTSLTSVTIPDSVTTIGVMAFFDCDSLTSVTIPDSVTTIGDSAFGACYRLTSVIIPDSVTTIGDGAFSDCGNLISIDVDTDNQYYSSDSFGVLYNKNKTELVQYPGGNERTKFTIPDSVATIRKCAFDDCDSLTSVTIPDSVTTIGDNAFWSCNSLTSVTIPDSVTTIGDIAFGACYRLTDVYYGGTQEQWNNISIGSDNEELIGANIHYNSNAVASTYGTGTMLLAEDSDENIAITYSGCVAGNDYILLNVISFSEDFTLSVDTLLYIDQLTADANGEIATTILPKYSAPDSVTVLIGDFGNGTEVKEITKDEPTPEPDPEPEIKGKVKSVSIDDISMSYKDSATITPSINADSGVKYTVSYSSSNTDVVSVDSNGKLTTNDKGSATITVTVTDEYGNTVTDTCNVNVSYKWWQWIIVIVLFGWIWY